MDYDYIKNYYRPIAGDLSKQNDLDLYANAIQRLELIGQLKNTGGANADGAQSMFVLTILEKIKETRLKFSQGCVIGL